MLTFWLLVPMAPPSHPLPLQILKKVDSKKYLSDLQAFHIDTPPPGSGLGHSGKLGSAATPLSPSGKKLRGFEDILGEDISANAYKRKVKQQQRGGRHVTA